MATVTRVTSGGLLELSATAGCHRRVPESGGGAGGRNRLARGASAIAGFDGRWLWSFFYAAVGGGGRVRRRVSVTHLLQNVNPGHNKWNICKAPGVISANCILISAVMGRMETSGRVDGSKWVTTSCVPTSRTSQVGRTKRT